MIFLITLSSWYFSFAYPDCDFICVMLQHIYIVPLSTQIILHQRYFVYPYFDILKSSLKPVSYPSLDYFTL